MKRFYKEVGVQEVPEGWTVTLDGKPMNTPARHRLVLPGAALAEAVAEEWRAQGETVDAASMPLTRLTTTATDLMPARRGDAVAEIAEYAGTDLLCYRASDPEELARRQDRLWQPWLDWAAAELDAPLRVTRALEPVEQPAPSLAAVRAAVEALADWRLVGAHTATTLSGSVILGLAMERGAVEPAAAFEAAVVDELYEIERWGLDELQEKRHARLRGDLEATARFLALLGR
ncbi:ATP12 family chaperone protein [Marinimicrococcus flavescens]|uniref:ATPase n=1 Tax=Marinimicrococcus flavescens TaxID=3031815 RepID=A0AAP3XR46_9PROT|nr:ATPase [Marinimicrococcus flavescens]